ncbi:MepB family protein (plasmid) [Vibrio coralliilyticus]|nr:MepB family protein [Vibrio coralliilyticus]WFB51143.1 MepB family protein [Vibrio coralliilyticus]
MLDPYPQNRQYEALVLSIDGQQILYRKGHVTPNRPGHFLTIWKRSTGEDPDSKKRGLLRSRIWIICLWRSMIAKPLNKGCLSFPYRCC